MVRDHVRAIEVMLAGAGQDGVSILQPALSNLTAIRADVERISDEFERIQGARKGRPESPPFGASFESEFEPLEPGGATLRTWLTQVIAEPRFEGRPVWNEA